MKFKKIIYLLIAMILCGCQQTTLENKVIVKLPKSITYSGKGAAAGIALMGIIGPSGIAIGAAIDVGVSKDIQSINSLEELELKIKKLVSTNTHLYKINIKEINILTITFNQSGSDEYVYLHIEGSFIFNNGVMERIDINSTKAYQLNKLLKIQDYANSLILENLVFIKK